MRPHKLATLGFVSAALLGLALPGSAALVTDTQLNSTARNFFTPSAVDLINGTLPTSSTYSGQFEGGAGQTSLPAFTDGSTGNATATTIGQVLFDRDSANWNTVYQFNTVASPRGYDITSIMSFAGHGDARVNQTFNIEVMYVSGAAFEPLASVVYNAVAGNASGNFSTLVTLADSVPGTAIASGVSAIRFTAFQPVANVGFSSQGGSIYRELDVIGLATVPEPSSVLLGLAGVVAMAGVRRRQSR